ncbi:Helix-turn-helix domain-containing protein [Asanoa hainanensis]|uniref:Helix-turn-helix domain-containing protein n=1 Tax=Asanoa hainanensis TaxID=560556 RepID=A0A239PDF4_9ACTN|nr:helix-turn-helix transcriptional regulator [Asanoa hainanensis]SNT65057.1 Helix-turn-helix domain-containing protein [Asanoa hainanensis]
MADSPYVARRRVRLAIRRARDGKGFTQTDVAEAMEWSLSKVMRIESGEVTISQNDLRPLLAYLGVKDKAEIESLVASAKLSKQRAQWWETPQYRDLLTPAIVQLIGLELAAQEIQYFYPMVVPGRLQTPAYTRAVFETFAGELTEEAIEARIRMREMRRQSFLDATEHPEIHLVLDESVLYRQVGGPEVLRHQLEHLLDLIGDQRIAVRIIPFKEQSPIPMLATYEIVSLVDGTTVLYRESDTLDEIVEDHEKIKRHREIFDRVWQAAYDEPTSAGLIKDHATALS